VNDWFQDGDVVIAPWLVGDDHKRIPKMQGQYMFGHFELPHFKMNAMVEMPDHGEIQVDSFGGFDEYFQDTFICVNKNATSTILATVFRTTLPMLAMQHVV
jgi:hypothetical protein